MRASSAPGEKLPPPPRSTHGPVFDLRHVAKTHEIVSDLQHNLTGAHTILSDIHRTVVKGREGREGILVSDARTSIFVECMFIAVQSQNRLANPTIDELDISCLHVVCLVNHLLLHLGPVTDVTN